MGISIREAIRRPPRRAPQLLVCPDRERVERALRYAAERPLNVVAIELERNDREAAPEGYVLELVIVVMFPPPDHAKRLTVRHVMPGAPEPDMRQIMSGAEALGQAIRMRFRQYGSAVGGVMVSNGI